MRISDWSSDVCSSDLMSAFYDRIYDVLVSTTIVESGLDIPSANTLVVHRADRFGLAQLSQQIGRASGRERVCQYVYISVGGVSLKKKTRHVNIIRQTIKINSIRTNVILASNRL